MKRQQHENHKIHSIRVNKVDKTIDVKIITNDRVVMQAFLRY